MSKKIDLSEFDEAVAKHEAAAPTPTSKKMDLSEFDEAVARAEGGASGESTLDSILKSGLVKGSKAALAHAGQAASFNFLDNAIANLMSEDKANQFRQYLETSSEENPIASIGGSIAGSVVGPAGALGGLAKGGNAVLNILKAGALGAGTGALQATGDTIDTDASLKDKAKEVLTGAALGGGFGLAAGGLQEGVTRGIKGLKDSYPGIRMATAKQMGLAGDEIMGVSVVDKMEDVLKKQRDKVLGTKTGSKRGILKALETTGEEYGNVFKATPYLKGNANLNISPNLTDTLEMYNVPAKFSKRIIDMVDDLNSSATPSTEKLKLLQRELMELGQAPIMPGVDKPLSLEPSFQNLLNSTNKALDTIPGYKTVNTEFRQVREIIEKLLGKGEASKLKDVKNIDTDVFKKLTDTILNLNQSTNTGIQRSIATKDFIQKVKDMSQTPTGKSVLQKMGIDDIDRFMARLNDTSKKVDATQLVNPSAAVLGADTTVIPTSASSMMDFTERQLIRGANLAGRMQRDYRQARNLTPGWSNILKGGEAVATAAKGVTYTPIQKLADGLDNAGYSNLKRALEEGKTGTALSAALMQIMQNPSGREIARELGASITGLGEEE